MPHRARSEDSDSGTRPRKKRKTSKSKKKPIPVPYYECLCSDCTANPQCHPTTLFPGRGCWLTKSEWKEHSKQERKRGVANTLLGQLTAPEMELPIPNEFGFLPRSPSLHTAQQTSPPTTPPIHSASTPDSLSEEDHVFFEVGSLLSSVRPALDIFEKEKVVFRNPPDRSKVDPTLLDEQELEQLCALDHTAVSNSAMLGYREVLQRSRKWIGDHPRAQYSSPRTRLKILLLERTTAREETHFKALLLEEWKRQANVSELLYSFDSTRYYLDAVKLLPPITLIAYLLVASLHLLCGLSIDHCRFSLEVLKIMVHEALKQSSDIFGSHTTSAFRGDVREVIDFLDLGPRIQAYVTCPSCCHLYPFDPDQPSSCPEICTNREGDQPCGAKLRRVRKHKGGQSYKPIRQYHHRSMKDYVAFLHSRPDLQQYLYTDPTVHRGSNNESWDVWDAPYLRNFLGPDGSTVFVRSCDKEGRLLFSLNMDGFNPYGNKESGKKVSIGGMYMICLNLPPSLRYNIENVYLVGVIPGPNEPSLHQINYFLRPLVDELLQFWQTGVYLTRTASHPRGWLVRCAMVPLVCDLPAARQMAGFSSHASRNFCSVCTQTLDDIQNINPSTWTLRDQASHRKAADDWLHAANDADRADLTNTHGVRWSELLRLPYWDPIRYTIIDSMHAFYLRLFQYHCRNIWGMSVKFEDGPGLAANKFVEPTGDKMDAAQDILRYGTKKALSELSKAILRQLCKNTGTVNHHGKKEVLVNGLLDYRVGRGWFSAAGVLNDDRRPAMARPIETRILVEPKIQTFIEKGIVPVELRLKTAHDVNDYYANADNPAMNKLTRRDLLTMVAHKVYPAGQITVEAIDDLTVKGLRDLIQAKRIEDGFINEDGWPRSKPVPVKKTVVLGQEVLAEIRKDMHAMSFPAWMTRPPSHPGEEAWGKFTADQWKTFCLYVLPVTLTRLWGDLDEDTIERRQLDNFMHLVTAVKLATMRKMTEDRITAYEKHILAYMTTLQSLYPDAKVTPYQHLSLHFGSFLRGFGPTHAWRCFPFERFNNIIQNMPTNFIFGEMEATLFHKFTCAQRLKSFFTAEVLPAAAQPLIQAFARAFRNDGRGTYLNDILAHLGLDLSPQIVQSAPPSLLSSPSRRLLSKWLQNHETSMDSTKASRRAVLHSHLERFGQKFTTYDESANDSLVLLEIGDDNDDWGAGSIQDLFTHTRTNDDASTTAQTFAVIALYQRPHWAEEDSDPYARYPFAGGKLFLNEFKPDLILVDFTKLTTHFSSSIVKRFGKEYLLALPLDKV